MGTKYHPAKLVQIPSKGNKWYVVVTKPTALQSKSKNAQVRRSTGTSDKREAELRLHRLAAEIYAGFDVAMHAHGKQHQKTTFNFLTPEQNNAMILQDPFIGQRMLQPAAPAQDPTTKLSRYLEVYMEHLETNGIGNISERQMKRSRIEDFISLIGDIQLSEVRKVHAYEYADWLAGNGKANKTIKSYVSRVSGMLTKAEQRGLIDPNPFTNLKLGDYGRPKQSYAPFEPDEMSKIFAQDMRKQERLIMTILATTGARLDEVALLEWGLLDGTTNFNVLTSLYSQMRPLT